MPCCELINYLLIIITFYRNDRMSFETLPPLAIYLIQVDGCAMNKWQWFPLSIFIYYSTNCLFFVYKIPERMFL